MLLDERITGTTKITGLIGCPVEHTVSPQLHNTLNAMLGINAVYIPFSVKRDGLEDAVKGLKACNLTGFNVTIPFKEEVLGFVDEYDDEVKLMGAANTIVSEGGRLHAYNTDAEGFARSFREQSGTDFKGKRVALLGAGGAARSLAVKIAFEGAEKLYILNRTVEKAERIAEGINRNIRDIAAALPLDNAGRDAIPGCDVIVNTTSLGLYPNTDQSPLDGDVVFRRGQLVYDTIYNPPETKLLKQARKSGCKTFNGMGMLFYQGILAYEKWMGVIIPRDKLGILLKDFLNYLVK